MDSEVWSPIFGHCEKSLRAHDETVTGVAFLPGTHMVVSCGKDRQVKVWDLDRYELVSGFPTAEVCAGVAAGSDGAFFFVAGEKGLRKWVRTTEQLFVEEERERELEEKDEVVVGK